MNETTQPETTELATMSPAARAVVALGAAEHEAKLRALLTSSAGIVSVTNRAGRDECHAAYMVLKNARCSIANLASDATEDAKNFTKAVKAEAARLTSITEAEEVRLQALRDAWDEKIEAEKQAKIAAERARIAAISEAIDAIRQWGIIAARCKTACETLAAGENLAEIPITDTIYQERLTEAVELKAATMAQIAELLKDRGEAECIEAQRLDAIESEKRRIAAERAELAKMRAEIDERNRAAKAEAERVAAAQAAEAARLADVAARQQAEIEAQADALARQVRAAKAKQDRASAEAQAKIDAAAAELSRQQAAFENRQFDAEMRERMRREMDAAHSEALAMDLQFDIDAVNRAAAAQLHVPDDAPDLIANAEAVAQITQDAAESGALDAPMSAAECALRMAVEIAPRGHEKIEAVDAVEMVAIPRPEYDTLMAESAMLHALIAEGVDNWDGYGMAMSTINRGD